VRPIVNLARRPIKTGVRRIHSDLSASARLTDVTACAQLNGHKEVGQPINKILQSVFDALTFEKVCLVLIHVL